jgi:hypothetical protein
MTLDEFFTNLGSTLHDWQEDGFVMEDTGVTGDGHPFIIMSYGDNIFTVTVEQFN